MNIFKHVCTAGSVLCALAVIAWAGLTAYNFTEIMQQFGGIYENLGLMLQHPDRTLEIVQYAFYNSLAVVGYTYHDLGMTGPFVLLYAIILSGLYLYKVGK